MSFRTTHLRPGGQSGDPAFARVDDAAGSAEFTLVDMTGVGPKNPGYVEGFLIELLDGDRLHLRFTFGGGPGRSGVENILVRRIRPG